MWLKYKDLREMTQPNSTRSFHVFRCAARCYVARSYKKPPGPWDGPGGFVAYGLELELYVGYGKACNLHSGVVALSE